MVDVSLPPVAGASSGMDGWYSRKVKMRDDDNEEREMDDPMKTRERQLHKRMHVDR